jgi:hypothetical protein
MRSMVEGVCKSAAVLTGHTPSTALRHSRRFAPPTFKYGGTAASAPFPAFAGKEEIYTQQYCQ